MSFALDAMISKRKKNLSSDFDRTFVVGGDIAYVKRNLRMGTRTNDQNFTLLFDFGAY